MKKYLIICTIAFILVFAGIGLENSQEKNGLLKNQVIDGKRIQCNALVQGDEIFLNTKEGLKETFLTGVNVGLGKPGYYPGDVGIGNEEYLRWFFQISDMGVNVIRVYTLQSPGFYQTLFEYNKFAKEPMYLIQGAYVNEALVEKEKDMWHPDLIQDFTRETQNVIDAVHGEANIAPVKGHAFGKYTKDVSPYVISYLMGIEFDGETVTNTNVNNLDKSDFQGKYLYTKEGAAPFEAMLASMGDFAIGYETDEYGQQKMIAFANWPTTDPLEHPDEPEEKNTMDGIDVENIGTTDLFAAGTYASYHVYPYYPDFLNFEDQLQFISQGAISSEQYAMLADSNPYRQYLYRLNQHHEGPVVITEFGVPTSRGLTHEDVTRGFNQGGVSEEDQGKMILAMLDDIKGAGLNGGVIFSWQDEWFKRTWNTMEQNTGEGRIRWHDVQTSEQHFGLLAFQPEERDYAKQALIEEKDYKIYVKQDEEYLWIKIQKEVMEVSKEVLGIVLDTKDNGGPEFLIQIDGKNNSRVLVNRQYDPFAFLFASQLTLEGQEEFTGINLRLRNRIYLPAQELLIEPSYYETGALVYGEEGDFYQKENFIEMKIPWLLLNVSDPSVKSILGDFQNTPGGYIAGQELASIPTEGISLGLIFDLKSKQETVHYEKFTWDSWEEPRTEERLKSSYYILQEAFQSMDIKE